MVICRTEQAVTATLVFMEQADQAGQIGRKLEIDALHFRIRDHADLRLFDSWVKGLVFVLRGLRRFQDIALSRILFSEEPIDPLAIYHFAGHAQG